MKRCPLIIASLMTREELPTYQTESSEAVCRQGDCQWWLERVGEFAQESGCAIERLSFLVNTGASGII